RPDAVAIKKERQKHAYRAAPNDQHLGPATAVVCHPPPPRSARDHVRPKSRGQEGRHPGSFRNPEIAHAVRRKVSEADVHLNRRQQQQWRSEFERKADRPVPETSSHDSFAQDYCPGDCTTRRSLPLLPPTAHRKRGGTRGCIATRNGLPGIDGDR